MNHNFSISIDDGDCRYEYPITIKNGDRISIHDIYKEVCKRYNAVPREGIYYPSKIKNKKDFFDRAVNAMLHI